MWELVDRFGSLLLDASLAASLWLGLAVLVMVACRQPVRRCAVARLALLGSLAIWPMVVLGPHRRIEILETLNRVSPPSSVTGISLHLEPPEGKHWRVTTLCFAGGAAIGVAWLVLGCWGTRWLTRHSMGPSHRTKRLYQTLPFSKGRSRPRLRIAARTKRPVLLGVLRPTILIPPALEHAEGSERLRLSLLHELAHAERRDPWFGLLSRLAQSLWFFLPPIWWISLQMKLDQEFLADHRAAAEFGPAPHYASSLITLATPPRASGHSVEPGPIPPGSAGQSSLFQRVLMLVRCPFPVETRLPLWWHSILVLFALGFLLLSTSLSLQQAQANLTPVSSAPKPHPRTPHQFLISQVDPGKSSTTERRTRTETLYPPSNSS